ncbi:MAG: hypothetical protein AAGP08_18935, partial [Pseudomonadota bacterium]
MPPLAGTHHMPAAGSPGAPCTDGRQHLASHIRHCRSDQWRDMAHRHLFRVATSFGIALAIVLEPMAPVLPPQNWAITLGARGGLGMARKRQSDEDVLKLLREIELNLTAGDDVASACRSVGLSDAP